MRWWTQRHPSISDRCSLQRAHGTRQKLTRDPVSIMIIKPCRKSHLLWMPTYIEGTILKSTQIWVNPKHNRNSKLRRLQSQRIRLVVSAAGVKVILRAMTLKLVTQNSSMRTISKSKSKRWRAIGSYLTCASRARPKCTLRIFFRRWITPWMSCNLMCSIHKLWIWIINSIQAVRTQSTMISLKLIRQSRWRKGSQLCTAIQPGRSKSRDKRLMFSTPQTDQRVTHLVNSFMVIEPCSSTANLVLKIRWSAKYRNPINALACLRQPLSPSLHPIS